MLSTTITLLENGNHLDESSIVSAIDLLIREDVSIEQKAHFLQALASKGETYEEVAAFARRLRSLAIPVPVDESTRTKGLIDVCGTGGDHQNTFNISTAVSLLVASMGIPVAKHGNRAVTSKSGSADVLNALGIPTELSPEEAADNLNKHHFAFFFALRYHPAFKHIAPARKLCAEKGQRTIFNFLGPLLNPALPAAQIIGVPDPALCQLMARALQASGVERGMIVCGETASGHMDEISITGPTHSFEFFGTHQPPVRKQIQPGSFPLQGTPSMQDLIGGSAEENAQLITQILGNKEKGTKRDVVLLNAAAAIYLSGQVDSIEAGWHRALEAIESGAAVQTLERLQGK